MSGQHTPGLWYFSPALGVVRDTELGPHGMKGGVERALESDIVRCLNCHDELVEALEAWRKWATVKAGEPGFSDPYPLAKTSAALAKAKGHEGSK